MWKTCPGEDGRVFTNQEIYVDYREEFYTNKYFEGLKSNTLRGWIYDIGLRIYNAKKWLHFFDKCMVLEILNQCLIIQAANCVVQVVEPRPCSHIRLHHFCVIGIASFATEIVLRQLIF